MIIDSAEAIYAAIKGNTAFGDLEDKEAIDALDAYFLERYRAAKADSRSGIKRDRYMFYQGVFAGLKIMAKIFKHHITAEAYNQNIDPLTGEKFGAGKKDN